MVNVLILAGYGINCEQETAYAFAKAGAHTTVMHLNDVLETRCFPEYQVLVFPGGFSYGDDTGSGKALANRLRNTCWQELCDFVSKDKLVIGICNGFQVMTCLGLLPSLGTCSVALTHNTSARYECRWVELAVTSDKCVFTRGVNGLELPVAHGEGRFYAQESVLKQLKQNGQIVLRYAHGGMPAQGVFPFNPNGSLDDIAGICDSSGRIFGLMPHPERYVAMTQYPLWCGGDGKREPYGLQLFRNAVEYFS
ncbi:phosphoribosylformylglycinamidine synthase I [Candidatus Woesearchaeota archaeon]|nr:phosphoribosylformylglycinamidine synthase I [Candidatus Woesearchaeota archaeon]